MNSGKKEIPRLKKITLAEDDRDVQTVVKIALETMGDFDVQLFSSGIELLQKADLLSADLILLDFMMPVMDGRKVLEKLHKIPNTADLPVIFLTAKVSDREIIDYKKMGAIGVIAKPFDPMTLADTIKNIWIDQYGK